MCPALCCLIGASLNSCMELDDSVYTTIVSDKYHYTEKDMVAILGNAYTPWRKTYRPALLIENKKLIKIVGFIGNDLETSVLLFSVSFCIIDKNAFCIANIRFIFGLQFVT